MQVIIIVTAACTDKPSSANAGLLKVHSVRGNDVVSQDYYSSGGKLFTRIRWWDTWSIWHEASNS